MNIVLGAILCLASVGAGAVALGCAHAGAVPPPLSERAERLFGWAAFAALSLSILAAIGAGMAWSA